MITSTANEVMVKDLRCFLWIMLFIHLSAGVPAQSFFKDLELSLNYTVLEQDRRLFDFPGRYEVLENSKDVRHDHDYGILVSKKVFEHGRFAFDAGLGYSMFVIRFQRPFEFRYFTDNFGPDILRYIDSYMNHRVRLSNEISFRLFGNHENAVNVAVPYHLNVSLNKNIRSRSASNKTFSKWEVEMSNFEVYPGLNYKGNCFFIGAYYRIFNLQKVDRILFDFFPEMRGKEFEVKNWTAVQIRFGVML